jgi:predicted molibdopterin-dependent oxidoreductase YjgC
LAADKVVAFVGIASHADGPNLAESVAALARQMAGSSSLLPLNSRSNTYGSLDMGLSPDLLPGRVNLDSAGCANLAESWGDLPVTPGRDTRSILEGLDTGDVRGLLMVGADPLRDTPDAAASQTALEAAEYVVSIDMFLNDSNRTADVILPAAGFAEKAGTVTNIEGRVQKLNQIRPAPGQARPDWAIIDDIAAAMGSSLGLVSAETISKEIAGVAPAYQDVTWDLLEWEHRDGVVVPIHEPQVLNHIPVAVAGSTAPRAELTLHVARTMYDDGVRLRHSPSLHILAAGPVAHINPGDAPKLGAQEGHRVRVVTSQGEGEFTVLLDQGTPSGVVYVPFNQAGGAQLGTDAVVRVTVVTE